MQLPAPLHWLKTQWMRVSHFIGMIMSKILLTVIWAVIFGLYSVVLHATGAYKEERKASWWVDALPDTSMKRQF